MRQPSVKRVLFLFLFLSRFYRCLELEIPAGQYGGCHMLFDGYDLNSSVLNDDLYLAACFQL